MSGHRVLPQSVVHFYSATKYAVTALTEGLRQELREAQTHIRATVRVWPGPAGDSPHPPYTLPRGVCPGCVAYRRTPGSVLSTELLALPLLVWPCSVLVSLTLRWEGTGLNGTWWGETEGKQRIVVNQVHNGWKPGLWALPLKAK